MSQPARQACIKKDKGKIEKRLEKASCNTTRIRGCSEMLELALARLHIVASNLT
jgi:hypothetical protein